MSVIRVVSRIFSCLIAAVFSAALIGWAGLAIWFDAPVSRPIAGFLAAAIVIMAVLAAVRIRPVRKAVFIEVLLFAVVLIWWRSISPSNNRNWTPDVSRLASAKIDGNQLTIKNVRNFDYKRGVTDSNGRVIEQPIEQSIEQWEEKTYDLKKLTGADLFLSYWGSPYIAHTIASWEFSDGQHLAISIETRKEVGEEYSAVLGFFRQFELYYVVAEERDVVRVRSNYRGEDVYLYRIKGSPESAQKLLINYLEEVNRLSTQPKWYNAFTDNCTTSIRHHRQNVGAAKPWDWRILVNGYLDQLGYSNGAIDTSLPFNELRARSRITERANAADGDPEFSERIRIGLPGAR